MEYKIIDVLDKRLVWLPDSLILFESSPLIENILEIYDEVDNDELIQKFDLDKQDEVKTILHKFKELKMETDKYKNLINDVTEDKGLNLSCIEMNPAFACNMRCKYCFAGDGGFYKKGLMSISMAKKAIDFLFEEAKERDTVYISLIGGEPLINYEMIEFVLEYSTEKAKKLGKNIKFATTTNGTLLTEEIMKKLDSYGVKTMISLDSHEPKVQNLLRPLADGQGSYEKIKNIGWKSMLKSENQSAIRATITPYNLNVFDIAKNYYESGFEHVHVEEVSLDESEFQFKNGDKEKLKDEYLKLAEYLKKKVVEEGKNLSSKPLFSRMYEIHNRKPRYNYCGAFQSTVGISLEGNIYPCDWLMLDDLCIGDLENGIDTKRFEEILNSIKIPHKCQECWARNICGRGCRAKHMIAQNEGNEIDCDLDLYKYQLQLYLYSEIAQNRPEFLNKFKKHVEKKEVNYESKFY